MQYKKSISRLVFSIIILSLIASLVGIFSSGGQGQFSFTSIHGENVKLYGKGIYMYDSISIAVQAIAQDIVTIILGIPLLFISLIYARRGLIKGRLLLTGTLGYFLYTYTSYSFLSMYNHFFLVYVALMSLAFFAFTLSMMSFDIKNLSFHFDSKLPVKFISGFLLFIGTAIGLMWIGRILPSLQRGVTPIGLEHYSTLTIQALDLGFVVPVTILSAILLLKRNVYGYLLSTIIIIKAITMLTAISAMIISMSIAGENVNIVEIVLFPLFNLIVIYCLVLIMKNVKE